jgi:glycosyltransferase involved in cell wall biosynthesis
MKILYVQHDMLVWQSARQWSYTTHMAYVDGLRAQGHEVLVVLTSLWSWARQIVSDHRFDQVWINDVTHIIGQRVAAEAPQSLDESDFAWLATLAPIRVGIVMESLHYDPEDYALVPELGGRVPLMQRHVMPYVTHLCAVDENDVRHIENMGVQAVWTPCHVPARFFRASQPRADRPAVFIGTTYGKRVKYAQSPRLAGLLEFRVSGEHATELPAMFDRLQNPVRATLLAEPYNPTHAEAFVAAMHKLRASLFDGFLDGLGDSMATVNLPSFVKTYGGRVVESMAAGQPVVSWRIPNRPQTARLFKHGETLMLFDEGDEASPERLADELMRLRREPGLVERIGAQAQANALTHHTSEHRVGQILEWVRRGITPLYWD